MTPADIADCVARILQPAVDGMRAEGTPYRGVLYAGLMLTRAGPIVLEFNCRFGDPETQAVLPMLQTDLIEVVAACLEGRLHALPLTWHDGACACVVLTSGGYPGAYRKGLPIHGLENLPDDVLIFYAGTRRTDDGWVTDGGRVLGVAARGQTPVQSHRTRLPRRRPHFFRRHALPPRYRPALRVTPKPQASSSISALLPQPCFICSLSSTQPVFRFCLRRCHKAFRRPVHI